MYLLLFIRRYFVPLMKLQIQMIWNIFWQGHGLVRVWFKWRTNTCVGFELLGLQSKQNHSWGYVPDKQNRPRPSLGSKRKKMTKTRVGLGRRHFGVGRRHGINLEAMQAIPLKKIGRGSRAHGRPIAAPSVLPEKKGATRVRDQTARNGKSATPRENNHTLLSPAWLGRCSATSVRMH